MMTNAIMPLIGGLLSGKNSQDYNLLFEKVLAQGIFQAESIMTDFETSTIKSVKRHVAKRFTQRYILMHS